MARSHDPGPFICCASQAKACHLMIGTELWTSTPTRHWMLIIYYWTLYLLQLIMLDFVIIATYIWWTCIYGTVYLWNVLLNCVWNISARSTESTLDFESYVHSQYKRTWSNTTSITLQHYTLIVPYKSIDQSECLSHVFGIEQNKYDSCSTHF